MASPDRVSVGRRWFLSRVAQFGERDGLRWRPAVGRRSATGRVPSPCCLRRAVCGRSLLVVAKVLCPSRGPGDRLAGGVAGRARPVANRRRQGAGRKM